MTSRRKPWQPAEVALLHERFAHVQTGVLARQMGRSVSSVHQKASSLGLKKLPETLLRLHREVMQRPDHPARAYLFAPGCVPHNRGVKHRPGWAPGRMASTQFKPGHKPPTWVPVGSYRVHKSWYGPTLEKKVSDQPGPQRLRWVPVHRLVWCAAFGPPPPGHVVCFKPGRRTLVADEITPDALECISRQEFMVRHSYTNLPPELQELTRLRASLTRAINTQAREQQDTGHPSTTAQSPR